MCVSNIVEPYCLYVVNFETWQSMDYIMSNIRHTYRKYPQQLQSSIGVTADLRQFRPSQWIQDFVGIFRHFL